MKLSLRGHPLAFLRPELDRRRIRRCADLALLKDGSRVEVAGLVLIRQKPGKGNVTFITIEDETGVANLVIWPSHYEQQRSVILTANMLAVKGRVQREGDVVHIVAEHLTDLSDRLAKLSEENAFALPHGRGDEFAHGSAGSPDSRDRSAGRAKPRDIYIPDLHIDTLKLKPRNFR